MNKRSAIIFTVIASCMVFTSFSPSLDGRAVVADKGEFPEGIFAKTVGYLPGDTILVSNLALEKTVDILVVGALDPSEGIAILLSHEAARALGIEKNANVIVKITKRAGQLDEAVAGTAVLTDGAAQSKFITYDTPSPAHDKESFAHESTEGAENQRAEHETENFSTTMTGMLEENPKADTAILNLLSDAPYTEQNNEIAISSNGDELPAAVEESHFAESEFIDAPVYDMREDVVAVETHNGNEIVEIDSLDDVNNASEPVAIHYEPLADERVTDEPKVLTVIEDEFEDSALFDDAIDATYDDKELSEQIAVEYMQTHEFAEENINEEFPDDIQQQITEVCDDGETVELFLDKAPAELTEVTENDLFVESGADTVEESFPEVVQESEETQETNVEEESYNAIVLDEQSISDEVAVQSYNEIEHQANYALAVPATPVESAALSRTLVSGNDFSNYIITALERGKYYIQIAVFADAGNISETVKKYETNYPLALLPLSSGKATQVMIGPLGVDEYAAVLEHFKSYGYTDAFLRKGN